jgi:hypothetical protein
LTTILKVFFIIFAVAVLSGCITPPSDNTPVPTSTPVQTPKLTETISSTVTQAVVINETSNESDITPNSENEFYSSDIIPDYEYEVYSSVISSIISSDFSHTSINKIVISQLTSNQTICYNSYYDCFQNFKNYSLKNDSILGDDYKNKNAVAYKLENKFSIAQTVIFISRGEFNKIFQNVKGWDSFYEKYPNSAGIISISRVGFNRNRTQAILGFSYQAGWLWGKGYRIFLTKDEGKWIVKEQDMLWVS